jgi:GntR family transcriptional regulator/MocR family aminotransferase
LLDWAAERKAWIVEDDYDSEYRYQGRPLAALQGLDSAERVVYVGTFAKVLFPSLRIGYLVAPASLVPAFVRARAAQDGHPPIGFQPALAEFLAGGAFASHVRRARLVYAERQHALRAALQRRLRDRLRPSNSVGGMNLVAHLAPGADRPDDARIARLAGAAGIAVEPLSAYYAGRRRPPRGLVLGFAAVPGPLIEEAVAALAGVIEDRAAREPWPRRP